MDNNIKKVVLDTSAIINHAKKLEEMRELYKFIVPTTVVDELDNMKESDLPRRKYMGRNGLRFLENNEDYITYIVTDKVKEETLPEDFDKKLNDNKIISCAVANDSLIATQDRGMKIKANSLNIEILELEADEDIYLGYKEIELTNKEWEEFINDGISDNRFDLLIGEYGIFTTNGVPKNVVKWNGKKLSVVKSKSFPSRILDDFKPKDLYQIACVDSLINNEFTLITGQAGTGKTLLSLSYLINALEKGYISKIYIAHNPISTSGAEKIGYLKGDKIEKMLGSSLGGILVSKFGGLQPIESMMNFGQLEIVPMSFIRGMEIKKGEALYITEAQNLTKYLAKTIIQRCASGSKIILEGDTAQVDSNIFLGLSNGFSSAINVFKGAYNVGIIELKNIYRNKFTELAEKI